MILKTRRQLTLFVDEKDAAAIEEVRAAFNPLQSKLIRSHVTLCREDEIEKLEQILLNLTNLQHSEVTIYFGKAIRFDDGRGLLLPAKGDNAEFQQLRRQILYKLFDNPRLQEPHITLMHPRNSTCTDAIYNKVCSINFPDTLVFKHISLIEQTGGGEWHTLQTFVLTRHKSI
jgi:hypothetical protein